MPDIKLIGLDLDGTLLTTTKELTENTKKVLIQALDAGIEVLVATVFTMRLPPMEPESWISVRKKS